MSQTPGFFRKQCEMTFQQLRNGRFLPNLTKTRESWVKRRFWKEIYEKFPFRGNLPAKPRTWRGSNRHLTQNRLQVKGCTAERYCTPRCSPRPASFQGLVKFFCTTYGCAATGHQNCPIFGFWPIFPVQNALECFGVSGCFGILGCSVELHDTIRLT